MGEPLRGKLTVLNPWPPIRRLWLRASEVRKRLSVAFPAEVLDRLRRQQQQPPPQPSGPQEPSYSSESSSAVSEHTQQQPPSQPQFAQELPTPRGSLLSLSSDETDAQSFVTAQLEVPLEALASPIALQRVTPNHGPISGGEEILLVGYGFSEDQGLRVRFGGGAEPVKTKWINPYNLHCTLPPCVSARWVIVTLHSPGRPNEIHNEGDICFKHEDVIEQIQALLLRVLDYQPQKGPVDYNQSRNPHSPSSPNPPSAPIRQSQHSPVQTMATHRSQSQTLSTDLNQIITEDDIIRLFGSVPLEQYCNSINLVNLHGQNLVHLCTQLGYHRLLVTVIERGADIHAKDANGWTPMDFARLHHDEDAIDILEGDWEEDIENIISTGSSSIDLLRRFISGGPPLNALTHDDNLRDGTGETAAILAGSMSADAQSVLSGNSVREGMCDSVQYAQYKRSPDASTIMHKPEEMPSPPRDGRRCTLSEMSTPLLNARASSSLAPFVAPFEILPMQTRDVGVPNLASSAIIVSKPKELEGSIDALRAGYSTIHSSTTLSQQIRNREQEGEADNDEEDIFVFVEAFEEGKKKAMPTPAPGVVSPPNVAITIVWSVEEKKEKEKAQEEGEETQEQTQGMTAVEAKKVRANTPSIWRADMPRFPATSLVGGAPPSGVPGAPSLPRVTFWISGQFTTNLGSNLGADWGTPTKGKLEKTTVNVPAAIPTTTPSISVSSYCKSFAPLLNEDDKSKTTAPRPFGFRAIGSMEAPEKTGLTTGLRSMDELNSTKPTTDEKVFPLTVGYLSFHKSTTDPWTPRDLQTLQIMYHDSSWLRNNAPEPVIGDQDCPDLAQEYGPRGRSCLTAFLRLDDNGNVRCRYEYCSTLDFRTFEDGLRHLRYLHFGHRPFICLPENGQTCGKRFYAKADFERHQARYHRVSKAREAWDVSGMIAMVLEGMTMTR